MKPYFLAFLGIFLLSNAISAAEKTGSKPADDLQHRTQQVVPYALDKTLQTFSKTVHGGVQHVVAKSADDTQQIKAIQSHLSKMATEFRMGDFSTTERLHGAGMPGLAQLKLANPGDIRFEYKALENGGQIHYSSEYPQYVQALHEWFEAQAKEHGNSPIPGHNQHHATPAD